MLSSSSSFIYRRHIFLCFHHFYLLLLLLVVIILSCCLFGTWCGMSVIASKKRILQICPFLFVFINRTRQHHNNVLFVVVCQPIIIYAACITLSAAIPMYNIHNIGTRVLYTGWFVSLIYRTCSMVSLDLRVCRIPSGLYLHKRNLNKYHHMQWWTRCLSPTALCLNHTYLWESLSFKTQDTFLFFNQILFIIVYWLLSIHLLKCNMLFDNYD